MQTFHGQVKFLFQKFIDLILPPRCVLTGDLVDRQGMLSPLAWASIDFITEPFCDVCGLPFEFEVEKGSLCTACLDNRPPYETARAVFKYNDSGRSMILGFKYADKTYAVKAFAPWLKRAGDSMLAKADYIIPVPLHYRRLISRRYNQSALIAKTLADETDNAYVADMLMRIRATVPQGHMNSKERFKNVKSAFAVNDRYASEIKGKTIVIIDDVYTTGATVRECTKALLKAGVASVHILVLARVVYSK
ncbi:MAG: ComF family protein [Alphaproteobacteria bacterium]|nr:ComF family protein [Alphaproteobacteria bacterium]